MPFPSPGDLPDPGIKPTSLKSPALAGRFFTTNTTWEALPGHQPNNPYISVQNRKQKLCGPMDCGPPGSSVHGILQARTLEWVAISFSRGSSRPRDRTWVSCIASRLFTNCATRKAQAALFKVFHKTLIPRNVNSYCVNVCAPLSTAK